jgi:Transposase, Mutator family
MSCISSRVEVLDSVRLPFAHRLEEGFHGWSGGFGPRSHDSQTTEQRIGQRIAFHAHWERITPMFAFPPDVKRMIYTTHAIESLNASLRKAVRPRGSFLDVDSLRTVLFLALQTRLERWGHPLREWRVACGGVRGSFAGWIQYTKILTSP